MLKTLKDMKKPSVGLLAASSATILGLAIAGSLYVYVCDTAFGGLVGMVLNLL